jgi:hypothetical protein
MKMMACNPRGEGHHAPLHAGLHDIIFRFTRSSMYIITILLAYFNKRDQTARFSKDKIRICSASHRQHRPRRTPWDPSTRGRVTSILGCHLYIALWNDRS